MGFQFVLDGAGVTPSTTAPNPTLKSAANIVNRITEISVGGEATSSTVNRLAWRRSGTDGVTPTAITPGKLSSSSPAAQSTANSNFTGSQPTPAAAPHAWMYALNVFGGVVRWVAAPGQEILEQGSTAGNDEAGFYTLSGTGLCSVQALFEEV